MTEKPLGPKRPSIFSNRQFRWGYTILIALVAFIILGVLVYRQKDVLLNYEWKIEPLPIILSFLFFTLDLMLVSIVWGWLMNTISRKLEMSRHIQYYCISNVAKRIPGTIWYIASRAQLYRQQGISIRMTSLASGMELALGVMSGIIVSLIFAIQIITQYRINPWFLSITFIIAAVILHPRIMEYIFRLLKIQASDFSYRDILGWLFAYIPVWLLGGVVFYLIAAAIYPLPINQLGYMIGSWALVGVISSALFFSPSNLGITEVGLSLLLSNIMPSSIAVLVAVISRVVLIFYEILWAVVFSVIRSKNSPD